MTGEMHTGCERVTVLIPTYNRAHLLPRAIDSILAQTAADRCAIIVVDDGSTDPTPAVVARYGDRVRYLRRENGGLAAARNTGLRAAETEYVAFLDDDDEWLPEKVALQLAAFERWPETVLVTGRARIREPDGRERPQPLPPAPLDRPHDFAPVMFEDNCLFVAGVMVRRAAFDVAGIHDESLRRRQDYHMWTRLACVGPFVYLSDFVCTYYADTPGCLSHNPTIAMLANLHVRRLLKRELLRRPDCRPAWRRGMALCLAILRDLAYQQGHYAAAAAYGARSLAYRPWGRSRWEWGRCAVSMLRAAISPLART